MGFITIDPGSEVTSTHSLAALASCFVKMSDVCLIYSPRRKMLTVYLVKGRESDDVVGCGQMYEALIGVTVKKNLKVTYSYDITGIIDETMKPTKTGGKQHHTEVMKPMADIGKVRDHILDALNSIRQPFLDTIKPCALGKRTQKEFWFCVQFNKFVRDTLPDFDYEVEIITGDTYLYTPKFRFGNVWTAYAHFRRTIPEEEINEVFSDDDDVVAGAPFAFAVCPLIKDDEEHEDQVDEDEEECRDDEDCPDDPNYFVEFFYEEQKQQSENYFQTESLTHGGAIEDSKDHELLRHVLYALKYPSNVLSSESEGSGSAAEGDAASDDDEGEIEGEFEIDGKRRWVAIKGIPAEIKQAYIEAIEKQTTPMITDWDLGRFPQMGRLLQMPALDIASRDAIQAYDLAIEEKIVKGDYTLLPESNDWELHEAQKKARKVEEEVFYEVERIVGHKGSGSNLEYKVRWKNFSEDHDEWVPLKRLKCDEAIAAYRAGLCIAAYRAGL